MPQLYTILLATETDILQTVSMQPHSYLGNWKIQKVQE